MILPAVPPRSGTRPFDVVGFGESSLDFVAVVNAPLGLDMKLPVERFEMLPGGQTATALVACARLGHRARYVGSLGDDAVGTAIERALREESIDVAAARREGARSRVAIILVDRASGRRTVLEHRDPGLTIGSAELDLAAVTSGRVLLVDSTDVVAAIAAARAARAAGIPTVVDVEQPGPGIEELLGEIDVLVVPERFPGVFTGASSVGEGLRRLESQFRPAIVVATLGAAGSLARYQGREVRTPPPAVDVVDTTGAGDAFRGGFIAGWLRFGPEASIETLLAHANTVAALNCRALGAQAGLPTPTEMDRFL